MTDLELVMSRVMSLDSFDLISLVQMVLRPWMDIALLFCWITGLVNLMAWYFLTKPTKESTMSMTEIS